MDARLRQPPSRLEFLALVLAAGALGLMLWLDHAQGYLPFDYSVYTAAARGDLLNFYYPDWILPLFWLLSRLPPLAGYGVWSVVNIACLFLAGRVFGGRPALVLLTFQFFYSLFLGNINCLLIGALALAWWGMAHRRWQLAGLGLWLAATKFQIGLPFGLLLWLAGGVDGRSRLQMLFLPALLSLASLAAFPDWPLHLVERLQAYPPYDWGSISLWPTLGPAALLFLLVPLILPMDRGQRLLALAAAMPLALPYYQSADLLVLFVLPVGWLPLLLGNLGFLFFQYQFTVLRLLWIVPLVIYLAALLDGVRIRKK